MWEIRHSNQHQHQQEGPSFKLINTEFVNVCDSSSMDVLNYNESEDFISIVGIGLEIFKIRK